MTALTHWLVTSQEFFHRLGWLGIVAYAALIVLVQLCLAPLAPLAVAGGFIFGLGGGFAAITLGTGSGAAINFLISRHLARDAIAHRIEKHEKFRLIDAAIGREGWRIIAMLRFCPIPYGFANYAYGLTAIPFWPYLIATLLAIIPGNVFFVWLGASAQVGLDAVLGSGRQRHPIEYVMLGVGLLAGLSAMIYTGKIARAALARGEAK